MIVCGSKKSHNLQSTNLKFFRGCELNYSTAHDESKLI